jgi:predicted RNase H-like HicB family nuclease
MRARKRIFTAVIEKCKKTGLYVGYIPGLPGAHTQASTLHELEKNLKEVLQMLQEDGALKFESQFVGTQALEV